MSTRTVLCTEQPPGISLSARPLVLASFYITPNDLNPFAFFASVFDFGLFSECQIINENVEL